MYNLIEDFDNIPIEYVGVHPIRWKKITSERPDVGFAEILSEKISRVEPEVSHATQLDEMKKAAEPLIKYLCENHHPHVTAIVTGTSIELLEGLMSIPKIYDYLVD